MLTSSLHIVTSTSAEIVPMEKGVATTGLEGDTSADLRKPASGGNQSGSDFDAVFQVLGESETDRRAEAKAETKTPEIPHAAKADQPARGSKDGDTDLEKAPIGSEGAPVASAPLPSDSAPTDPEVALPPPGETPVVPVRQKTIGTAVQSPNATEPEPASPTMAISPITSLPQDESAPVSARSPNTLSAQPARDAEGKMRSIQLAGAGSGGLIQRTGHETIPAVVTRSLSRLTAPAAVLGPKEVPAEPVAPPSATIGASQSKAVRHPFSNASTSMSEKEPPSIRIPDPRAGQESRVRIELPRPSVTSGIASGAAEPVQRTTQVRPDETALGPSPSSRPTQESTAAAVPPRSQAPLPRPTLAPTEAPVLAHLQKPASGSTSAAVASTMMHTAQNREIAPPDDVTVIQQVIRLKGSGPLPPPDSQVLPEGAVGSRLRQALPAHQTPAMTAPQSRIDIVHPPKSPASGHSVTAPWAVDASSNSLSAADLAPYPTVATKTYDSRPLRDAIPVRAGPIEPAIDGRHPPHVTAESMRPTPGSSPEHSRQPPQNTPLTTMASEIRLSVGAASPALVAGWVPGISRDQSAQRTHHPSATGHAIPSMPINGPNQKPQAPRPDSAGFPSPAPRLIRPEQAAVTSDPVHPKTAPPALRTAVTGASFSTGIAAPEQTVVSKGRGDKSSASQLTVQSDTVFTSRIESFSSAAPHAQTAPTRMDLPSHVARQIIDVAQHLPARPVEISLSPEELGRVRLSVTPTDAGLTVNVLAERQETLDLLRRHIHMLEQEFQSLGYEGVAFSFSDGQPTGNDRQQNDNTPAQAQPLADTPAPADPVPRVDLKIASDAALDLRL